MRERWERLEFLFEDASRAPTDFVALMAGSLAFNERVLTDFSDVFGPLGELLDLSVNGKSYYALNVLRRIDALDLDRSGAKLHPHGTVKSLDRYIFMPDAVASESIFQIPQMRATLFVATPHLDSSSDFYARYMNGRYTGLMFKERWESQLH